MSNNPFANPIVPSAAHIMLAVKMDADISARTRRDIISAWTTACTWFGVAPEELVAHPRNLRPRFAKLSPGGLGVTKKRISNVSSLVRKSLSYLPGTGGKSFKAPLLESWVELQRKILNPYKSASVRCIMRLASALNMEPNDLDESFGPQLLQALNAEGLNRRPKIVHQNALRCWNQLSATMPGWPSVRFDVPRYGSQYVLPPSSFHPDLIAAFEALLKRNTSSDPFDLDAPLSAWKLATVETYSKLFRRYLSVLAIAGEDVGQLRRLEDIVNLDLAMRAYEHRGLRLNKRGRATAANTVSLLAVVSAHLSRDKAIDEATRRSYVGNTEALKVFSARLHETRERSTANRERLAPLRHEPNLARLFLLPLALECELSKVTDPNRQQALLMEWIVALVLLAFSALRVSTLCSLHLDRHLVWARPGMKGALSLELAEGELKNNDAASIPLPSECARVIRLYIELFRPVLVPGNSRFLFPGRFEDRPKRAGVMSTQIARLIRERTGFVVNVHLYRHVVHLVVLKRFPGAYAVIARVLTHRSIQTAVKNYSEFDVGLAMGFYQRLVRDVQNGASQSGSPSDTDLVTSLNRGESDYA